MINTTRHNEVFDAHKYHDKEIIVVGQGAIGSRVSENLVCAGLTNLTLVDFDIVEDHNIANQLFTRDAIGQKKTEAMYYWVYHKCGKDTADKINFLDKKLDSDSQPDVDDASIIISCVDTFDARRMLMGLAKDVWADMFVEGGMATGHGSVFMVDPSNPSAVRDWESTLGDDDDPSYEVSACGTGLSVGVTATMIAAVMSWNVMNYLKTEYVEPKLRIDTAPWMVGRIDQR